MATRKTPARSVEQPRKDELRKRLRRISGQVQGIQTMLEEDRYCVDILTQISACRSALDSVAGMLLEDHTRHCVANALKSAGGEEQIKELIDTFKKYR